MNAAEIDEKTQRALAIFERSSKIGKRTLDIGIAALGLLMLFPLMVLTALAIVLDSPGGSPIFAQIRIGKDGKPFTMYKFRSMYPRAEEWLAELLPYNEMDGPAFKMRHDPRVTCVGTFFIHPYGDVMPCNGTKDKEVMGNLNRQSWDELWNSPEAEQVRRKVRCCDRDCWMIGSVSPAMHKYIWVPGFWVVWHKLKTLFTKKSYSMYENKIVRDYRDGKVSKEELDKCSTCEVML